MKLQHAVETYLQFKRSLGMRMQSEGSELIAFCRVMGDPDMEAVRPAAVLAFICGSGPITHAWKQKVSVLRSFYRFALERHLTTTVPLPENDPQFPPLRSPYIYSTTEVRRLVAATEVLHRPRVPLQALGYRTLLLLLYGTGMIGEAVALTVADVDRLERVITVRNTKFFKSRLVPIGPKLTEALSVYARCRTRQLPMPAGTASAFFATNRGTGWYPGWTEALFCRLRQHANVVCNAEGQSQPRLHDLRHTHVQHQLLAWYRAGKDVQHLLPKLATYLGHVDVRSLQHYLAITPELLHEANQRFERYADLEHSHA
ncbi:tyrosine-type recombinase/integrase [Nitrobacter sp.]|uniref:tyrosine-type recombinase/integrase n=1 Tax=Nitrobacter sp. TaxID=29420 RepID=UPI003F64AF8F